MQLIHLGRQPSALRGGCNNCILRTTNSSISQRYCGLFQCVVDGLGIETTGPELRGAARQVILVAMHLNCGVEY
jgi:hypothetical protein